jgi:cyclopropane fatty-acyl-phospholipid synthase-like methyltransferase
LARSSTPANTARVESHWARQVYVDNTKVYQPVLESGLKTAPGEVEGIAELFGSLGVPRAGRVLDVACGIGRHSVHLAKHHFDVVGYDQSPTFLRRARQLAAQLGVSHRTTVVLGEFSNILQRLNGHGGLFDAIIIMDGSLGVTGKDWDDLNLLRRLCSLAAKDCVLLVESFDRDAVARRFQMTLFQRFPGRMVRISTALSKPGSKVCRARWRFYREMRNGDLRLQLISALSYRSYSLEEMKNLLRRAGWKKPLVTYGDISQLRAVNPEGYRTFVASKM